MWIPEAHALYYNPTENRVPNAILAAHFGPAIADTTIGQPGVTFPLLSEDDAATRWLGFHAKVVSLAIQPPILFTMKEALAQKEAERKAKLKGG